MKNVTVSLDDELHRKARIRAAELGTSLSTLVKQHLETLAGGEGNAPVSPSPVRDMQTGYTALPAGAAPASGPPYRVNGKKVWTRDGKPRQPGALRGKIHMADDFDEWPEGFLDAMLEDDTPDAENWWKSANEVLKSGKDG